jgi:hypothetical protein
LRHRFLARRSSTFRQQAGSTGRLTALRRLTKTLYAMTDHELHPQSLILISSSRKWVLSNLESLYKEWCDWADLVSQIEDHTYDTDSQTEVWADGEENMQAHDCLQAKTLTFLDNNIKGHGFIKGFDGKSCDRTDLRLKHRVKNRLHRLEVLMASLEYATEEYATEAPPDSRQNSHGYRNFVSKHWKWFVGAILVPILIALFL